MGNKATSSGGKTKALSEAQALELDGLIGTIMKKSGDEHEFGETLTSLIKMAGDPNEHGKQIEILNALVNGKCLSSLIECALQPEGKKTSTKNKALIFQLLMKLARPASKKEFVFSLIPLENLIAILSSKQVENNADLKKQVLYLLANLSVSPSLALRMYSDSFIQILLDLFYYQEQSGGSSVKASREEEEVILVEIFRNFTTCESLRNQLRKAKINDLFYQVMTSEKPNTNKTHSVRALIGYANLLGADEEKAKQLVADRNSVSKMIELFNSACFHPNEGWTLLTVLSPLCALAVNANIRKILWQTKFASNGLMILIPEAVKQIVEKDLVAEAGLLCSMTLQFCLDDEDHLQYKTALQQNSAFVSNLQRLGEKITQPAWKSVKANVEFLIGTLKTDEERKQAGGFFTTQQQPDSGKVRVMISYNWGSQPLVKEMVTCLSAIEGVEVVWDLQFMSGNIYDKMANAVVTSDFLLIVLSTGYRESANCKAEFCMARDLRKRMIFVSAEPGFVATEYLLAVTAGVKINNLFEMGNTKQVMENIYAEYVAPVKQQVMEDRTKNASLVRNQQRPANEEEQQKTKKTVFVSYHKPSNQKLFEEIKQLVLKTTTNMEVISSDTLFDNKKKQFSSEVFFQSCVHVLERVSIVVVLLNSAYCSNALTKNEFLTCLMFRKKIIPIFTEQDFTAEQFPYVKLGIGGLLYYSVVVKTSDLDNKESKAQQQQVLEEIVKKEII